MTGNVAFATVECMTNYSSLAGAANGSQLGTRKGNSDGAVAGCLRKYDCSPRDAFIKRLELAESDWPAYRDAYVTSFAKAAK